MDLLEALKKNKGTVSSALSKKISQDVLNGDLEILKESIRLISFDDKNVRSGAAKIIECVAEKKPEYVYKDLSKLYPALMSPEPQTRWMLIHIFGLCAKLNSKEAERVLPICKKVLSENSGACLWDRSIVYLGCLGAVSEYSANLVFPTLEESIKKVPSRITRIFESFEQIVNLLNKENKNKLTKITNNYLNDKSPSIKSRAKKIEKILNKTK